MIENQNKTNVAEETYLLTKRTNKENPIIPEDQLRILLATITSLRKEMFCIMLQNESIKEVFQAECSTKAMKYNPEKVFSYTPKYWVDGLYKTNKEKHSKYIEEYNVAEISKLIREHYVQYEIFEDVQAFYFKNNLADDSYKTLYNLMSLYKNKIVNSSLRLALDLSRRFRLNAEHRPDSFQEAMFGLTKSIYNYDINMNTKFSSHAYVWMYATMKRSYQETSTTVAVPVSRLDHKKSVFKFASNFANKHERMPNMAEFREHFKEVQDLDVIVRDTFMDYVYVDIYDTEDDCLEFKDVTGSLDHLMFEDKILKCINEGIESVSDEKHLEVVKLLYGYGDKKYTRPEVVEKCKISLSECRTIEKRALELIKSKLLNAGFSQQTVLEYLGEKDNENIINF